MNKDDKRRREILGIPLTEPYMGGTLEFKGATQPQLQQLLDEGFAEAGDCQNDAPEYQEFVEFLGEQPTFTANGYIVDPERDDCRVTVTGVDGPRQPRSITQLEDFVAFARGASAFSTRPMSAWWD